ncbi:MAG: YlmH/Sll1252 family protein, partial [Oscillospiraceae bacterium]
MSGHLAHLGLNESEQMFAARMEELSHRAQQRSTPCFSHFLDERQQAIASQAAADGVLRLYGGYPNAERVMLGIWPDFLEPSDQAFPIETVTFRFRKGMGISHRDLLGTLMSLKIKREAIGDLLVGDALAVAFVSEAMVLPILQEITKIGGVGVTCVRGMPESLPAARKIEPHDGVVSSMRLDCVVALLASVDRAEAQRLIRSGSIFRNAQSVDSVSKETCEGDKLSIRGVGK